MIQQITYRMDIAMSTPNNLKTTGLKATLPRLRILSLFESSSVRHLSAEDVYRTLISEGEDIGLATVYRVLTQFEQAGLLERHHFESGKAVFELASDAHHDHLVCLQCGRVEEFYDAEIEKRRSKIAKDRGFAIHEHSLSLYADCIKPACPTGKRRKEAPGKKAESKYKKPNTIEPTRRKRCFAGSSQAVGRELLFRNTQLSVFGHPPRT